VGYANAIFLITCNAFLASGESVTIDTLSTYWLGLFGSTEDMRRMKLIIEKMWVCYLCARAFHLELVHRLSAQQLLDCLRRFVARRGRPHMIISDNTPQFQLVKTVTNLQ